MSLQSAHFPLELLMWLTDAPDAIWERSLNELQGGNHKMILCWTFVGSVFVPARKAAESRILKEV